METSDQFLLEQTTLEKMLNKIKARIQNLDEKSFKQKEYIKYLYSIYTPDDTEYHTDIPVAEEMARNYEKDLRDIQKIKTNPYFGKITLRFDADRSDSTYYIGKKAIDNDTDTGMTIIDWRAPIANVYYSGKLGRTSFDGPNETIGLDLKLKRTIKIRDGVLESIYDAEVVANDELLLDYLSQSKGLVLNEIIATIQDEQNAIIRKSIGKNVIVQGVAGSGKTTVAIHRISYLLYSYRELLNFENIFLIAANPLFLNYITSMLPDLDVPVIRQETMKNLLLKEYQAAFSQEAELDGNTNPIYDNNAYVPSFTSFFDEIEASVFKEKELEFLGYPLLDAYQIENIKSKKSESLLSRAKALDELIEKSLTLKQTHILWFISDHKEEPVVQETVRKQFKLKGDYIFDSEVQSKYPKFKQNFKNYYTRRVKKLNVQKLFGQFTKSKGTVLSLCDIACMLSLYFKINGSTEHEEIKHIVIDEAQDFNITIYYFLRCLFPNATFTIVGDIMQNIERDGLDSWDSLKQIFQPKTDYMELLKSYRNTYEISRFTKKVMESIMKTPFHIDPLKRHGDPVSCIPFETLEQKIEKAKEIFRLQQAKGRKLNALICKNAGETETLSFELNHTAAILNADAGSLEYGNYIVDIKSAKGLEFDSVIIWDFDSYTDEEYKLLYVAMTRALHSLYVFTNNGAVAKLADEKE